VTRSHSRTAIGADHDPARLTLGRFLGDVAELHSERIAVVCGERRITFAQLRAGAEALARGLVGVGVVKGARVGLLLPNAAEWIEALFACGLVGAVAVPINTFATRIERDHMLRHGDVSVLLHSRRLLKRDYLEELRAEHPELERGRPGPIRCAALPQLRRVFCVDVEPCAGGAVGSWDELRAAGSDVPPELVAGLCDEVHPSDEALIIYTSGSMALPKGVLHVQRTPVLQGLRFAELMELEPDDRLWTAQPFFWTAGIAMSLIPCLAAGSTLLLQSHFDPGAALELIERERATTLLAWPHQYKAMAEHPDARRRDLSSLAKVEVRSPLREFVGKEKPEWGPMGYGLTETFTISTSLSSKEAIALGPGTFGPPLPGVQLRIVDPATGRELPPGEPGEIAVKGTVLMRGYYKVEPERWQDAEGWFHSGDAGWIDASGHLQWTGRIDDMIKTGGANVSPLEIERALDSLPALRASRAVGVPHPTLGQALVLCAILAEGASVSEDEVRSHLRARLSTYKLPRRVLFFAAGELDLTGNQKIRVEPLRAAALARLGAERAVIEGHAYGA
jgi:acyl-CoA synthetase (AMP-forming)/AMP-acid ligase II